MTDGVPPARDAVSLRSYEALRYAQELNVTVPSTLALRLYRFGTVPQRVGARRRWSQATLAEALGAGFDAALEPFADHGWRRLAAAGWLIWKAPEAGQVPTATAPVPKIYVCPHPDGLGEVLPGIAEVVVRSKAFAFKVPLMARQARRPDKAVAYFAHLEHALAVGPALSAVLSRVEAQPAPFTAALAADGSVSYGVDPPADRRPMSWRTWMARRLADHLLRARAAPAAGDEPWERALLAATSGVVELPTWAPMPGLWAGAAGLGAP